MTGGGGRTGAALGLGFAATVAMWAVAYVGRLPLVGAPAWALAVALPSVAVAAGVWAGRRGVSWRDAAAAGAVSGVLNLLVLGGLLAGEGGGVRPAAVLWVPGWLLASTGLVGGAAAIARRQRREPEPDWTGLLAAAAVAATGLLVVAGGLVTSAEAGLAVVDWPNTYGYAMFLYPLQRMTGGIYYEHAHRLLGSLVGLATVAVAWRVLATERRRWVRCLAVVAVVLVVVQGVLGGLRVTGRFTLSASPEEVAPNLALAVVHGVSGQLFLALMVLLAAVGSRRWMEAGGGERPASGVLALQWVLLASLGVQLVLGALQRHLGRALALHVTVAGVVAVVAAVVAARSRGRAPVPRLASALGWLTAGQLALGGLALAVTGGRPVVGAPSAAAITVATAHQACGAALLAVSVLLAAWSRR